MLAFAAALKLYDQVGLLQSLQECTEPADEMDELELLSINQLFQYCNKQMRTWRTGLINTISERVNREVEEKHRSEKHARVEKEEKEKASAVEQIDTSSAPAQNEEAKV